MSAPVSSSSKFSPLAPDRAAAIIDSCAASWALSNVDFAGIAAKVSEVSGDVEYSEIVAAARSGALSAGFIEGNFQKIAKFLNVCGLIGYEGEHEDEAAQRKGPYSIGAQGLSLITAYQRSKTKNAGAHEVVVVQNEDLETASGSKKTADIFAENKGVITVLAKVLHKDLDDNAAVDFNRTYLVETFGAAGGNHVVALTVRKRPEEECPVFDLFDPSPGLIRGGLASCQNASINGWSAQMQMNATLCEVMGDKFDREKFYHNMEPFQVAGASNCSIFSYEKAWITAAMSREEHDALLAKHYKFDSPYGGKCELAIDMDKVMVDGGVVNPQFNLPPQYYVFSNFLTSSVHKFHMEALEKEVVHAKKFGEEETGKDRLERYTHTSDSGAPLSRFVEEKAFRHKYGHLLEMVCHPHFVERFAREGAEFAPVSQCYYSASYKADQVTPESLPYVKAINRTLPMTNQVYSSSVVSGEGDEKFCKMVVFVSEDSAKKFAAFEPFSKLGIAFDEVPKSASLFGEIGQGIDPRLYQGVCLTFQVPMQEEVLKGIGQIKRADVFPAQKPSTVAATTSGAALSGTSVEVQKT